jgi:hypothetical protein
MRTIVYLMVRLDPRWEPYAGKLYVRICAGARGTRVPTATCWLLHCIWQRLAQRGSEAKASNLRQLFGDQRKCMDGRPRPPSTQMAPTGRNCREATFCVFGVSSSYGSEGRRRKLEGDRL